MFNTELFVVEVQKRPCLWNVKDNSHSDRQQKLQAWQQIAKVLNTSSDLYSVNNKNITIDVLQRKWKHLRDYYTREKKRTSKPDSSSERNRDKGSSVVRKRKSPLLDMLQFLDINRGNDIVDVPLGSVEDENAYPESNEEGDKSISEYECSVSRPTKIQRVEAQQSHVNARTEDNDDSTDKQFLISLLPILKKMNTREKLKFRTQLMNMKFSQEHSRFGEEYEDNTRITETRKVEKLSRKSEETEVVNKEIKSSEASPKRDEFSIYGEYVANKLRNIRNAQARHTAEFHINGILYKAEMGEYDIVSRDTMNTSRSVNSKQSNYAGIIHDLIYEDDDSDDIIATVIKTEALDSS